MNSKSINVVSFFTLLYFTIHSSSFFFFSFPFQISTFLPTKVPIATTNKMIIIQMVEGSNSFSPMRCGSYIDGSIYDQYSSFCPIHDSNGLSVGSSNGI
jgi:hypothetical protein